MTTAAILAVAVCGCQSTNFQAATLPVELRAPPVAGGSQIHLPNLAAAAARSSAISPGDLLDVRIASGLDDDVAKPNVSQVSTNGEIDLPLIGPVAIAGLDSSGASRAIAQAAVDRGVYRRPNVTLEVRERATHEVTVIGAVSEPGVHKLPIGASDVLSAIAAAGGLTEEAGTEVQIMRQPPKTILAGGANPALPSDRNAAAGDVQQVAYNQAYPRQALSTQPSMQRIDLAMATSRSVDEQQLGDRDVVMVSPRKKRVIHVTGLVQTPDQFELPTDQDIRVLDAIAMAGGRSSPVADKTYVIRQTSQGQEKPAVIEVSISKAKKNGSENLILAPGDLVSVESTVTTTVVDVVESFFRVSLGLTSTAFRF